MFIDYNFTTTSYALISLMPTCMWTEASRTPFVWATDVQLHKNHHHHSTTTMFDWHVLWRKVYIRYNGTQKIPLLSHRIFSQRFWDHQDIFWQIWDEPVFVGPRDSLDESSSTVAVFLVGRPLLGRCFKFEDNGAHCDSLDSQSLRIGFITLSRLTNVNNFASHMFLSCFRSWHDIYIYIINKIII